MAKKSFSHLIIFGLLTLVASCNRPACKNTNQVFEKYSPETKEYKDELIRQLDNIDKTNLTYWMDSYKEQDSSKYIQANIQGKGICTKIFLTVKSSQKGIEGILKNKAGGYRGAELENLQFDIYQDSVKTEFIFKEISGVVD